MCIWPRMWMHSSADDATAKLDLFKFKYARFSDVICLVCRHRACHISRNARRRRLIVCGLVCRTVQFESTHNVVKWFSAVCSAVARLITSEVPNRTDNGMCLCVCYWSAKDDTTECRQGEKDRMRYCAVCRTTLGCHIESKSCRRQTKRRMNSIW